MASALCHSEGIERVKWGNSRSERAPSYPFRLLSERNVASGMTSKAGAINSRHLLRVLEELADRRRKRASYRRSQMFTGHARKEEKDFKKNTENLV